MRNLIGKLAAGSMIAGAALLVAACGGSGSEANNAADTNLTNMDLGNAGDPGAVETMGNDNGGMGNGGAAAGTGTGAGAGTTSNTGAGTSSNSAAGTGTDAGGTDAGGDTGGNAAGGAINGM